MKPAVSVPQRQYPAVPFPPVLAEVMSTHVEPPPPVANTSDVRPHFVDPEPGKSEVTTVLLLNHVPEFRPSSP